MEAGNDIGKSAEFIESREMDNVEIVGLVARDEMADRLRDIDVGIVPMVSTSIPNKVFDYIASYTPQLVLGENDQCGLSSEITRSAGAFPTTRQGSESFSIHYRAKRLPRKRRTCPK